MACLGHHSLGEQFVVYRAELSSCGWGRKCSMEKGRKNSPASVLRAAGLQARTARELGALRVQWSRVL